MVAESVALPLTKDTLVSSSKKNKTKLQNAAYAITFCVGGLFVLTFLVYSIYAQLTYELATTSNSQTSQTYGFANAAVATDNANCSQIGSQILQDGGNAVDAAVASTICLGVLQPFASGIGGGGVALIYEQQTKKIYHYDFREIAPKAANTTMYVGKEWAAEVGGLAVAVPGEIAGLWIMWKNHGKLPWDRLFQPSIALANFSYVNAMLAQNLQDYSKEILESPTMASVFAPNGTVLKEGDVLLQPALANTLTTISKDPSSFYLGQLAQNIVNDIQSLGGIVTMEDMRYFWDPVNQTTSPEYSETTRFNRVEGSQDTGGVKVRPYLSTWFQGLEVIGAYPPFSGGVCTALALNLLEPFNLAQMGANSSLAQHYMVEAWKWAFSDRMAVGDPAFVDLSKVVPAMLSKSHAAYLRQKFSNITTYPVAHYVDLVDPLPAQILDSGTSHLSVVDAERNAVALTTTVNLSFGAQVLSTSTGIVLNDEMADFSSPNATNAFGLPPSTANFIQPYKKPLSSMTPTFVFLNDKLLLVIGASGGPKIITATMQSLLGVVSLGMSVGDAIGKPRCHNQLTGDTKVETAYPLNFAEFLKQTNHIVVNTTNTLAAVQGIFVKPDNGIGYLEAASDWRKKGIPAGY